MNHFSLLPLIAFSLPVFAGSRVEYLALGDSVAFGYDPLVQVPIESNYTGYPEIVAQKAPQYDKLMSLACPGETSGSFLSATAPDNGCRGFKSAFGLHTNYTGTQADFAVATLANEPQIKLVTISIGGNDLLLLQAGCNNDPACILQKLPQVLATYGQNLTRILTRLRLEARYRGRIALVTYYSPNYRDPVQTTGIAALDLVLLQIGALFNATVADGYGSFALASLPFRGDTCAAGLLVRISPTACDVHPSPKGRDLLADVVLRQVR